MSKVAQDLDHWTPISRGAQIGPNGELYLDLGELLREEGFTDTPEHRAMFLEEAKRWARFHQVEIVEEHS